MRFATGYDKNYIDGSVVEHVKMKPQHEIKGVIKIQIFDEDGMIEREIVTENRVTDSIARMAFMDYYCCRIRGNPWGRQWEYNDTEVGSNQTNKDNNYYEQNGQYAYFAAPFAQIFLTDDITPEIGFESAIKGNIIGWADKARPYAGASTSKGTINLSESIFTENNLHFVFDFSTSVANGTFQKIYWADMRLDSIQENFYGLRHLSQNFKLDSYIGRYQDTPPPTNFTPGQTSYSYTHYFRVFKYQEKLHVIGCNNTTGKMCMGIMDLNTNQYTEVDLHTTMVIPSTSYKPNHWMMAHEGNYVYMFYVNNPTKLHRLNLDDYTKVEIILTNNYRTLIGTQIPEIPLAWYSNIDSYMTSGLIGMKNGRLYIPIRYVEGAINKTFILVCVPDENLTKTALYDLSLMTKPAGPYLSEANTLSGYNIKLQPRDADTWYVCNGSYTFITDNNFNIIDSSYRYYSFNYDSLIEDEGGSFFRRYYVSMSGSQVYRYGYSYLLWEPIAAMTLLPSPVTKTPTNTMKIQYDFNIQKVDPFRP